jgi:hypothetical protein
MNTMILYPVGDIYNDEMFNKSYLESIVMSKNYFNFFMNFYTNGNYLLSAGEKYTGHFIYIYLLKGVKNYTITEINYNGENNMVSIHTIKIEFHEFQVKSLKKWIPKLEDPNYIKEKYSLNYYIPFKIWFSASLDNLEDKHESERYRNLNNLSGFSYKSDDGHLEIYIKRNIKTKLREETYYCEKPVPIDSFLLRKMREKYTNGEKYFNVPGYFIDDEKPVRIMIEDYLFLSKQTFFIDGMYTKIKVHTEDDWPVVLIVNMEFPELVFHKKHCLGVMTKEQYIKALDKFKEELLDLGIYDVSWKTADILRLDLYKDIKTERDFQSYIPLFNNLHMRYCRKSGPMFNYEYVFKNGTREIVFYDKKNHLIDKKEIIPEILKNDNIMRVEVRYKKAIILKKFKFNNFILESYDCFQNNFDKELNNLLNIELSDKEVDDIGLLISMIKNFSEGN